MGAPIRAAGRASLYSAASRHGGVDRWKRLLGLCTESAAEARRPRPPAPTLSWSEARVEAELRQFLDGRKEWPAWSEFVAAGRQPLREAASRFADARHWAERLGVRYMERRGRAPWTAERLRAELAPFLAGRRDLPGRREFEAAGKRRLWYAMTRLGGPERWAAEFGLELQLPAAGQSRGERRPLSSSAK